MKRSTLSLAPMFACLALLVTTTGMAFGDAPQPLKNSKDVKWGPAPMLPKGAKIAVLAGNPAEAGLISLRLMMPAGYKMPAHWHPMDEQVTVLSGTINLGMGDKLDESKSQKYSKGGFYALPAQKNHFAWTKTGTTVQISLMGPFAITYANQADDPRVASAK